MNKPLKPWQASPDAPPSPGPFAQLDKLVKPEPDDPKLKEYLRVACPNLQLLSQGIPNVKLAERFGISASGIARYLKDGKAPVSFELAATYMLEEQTRIAEENGKTDIFSLLRRVKAHYRQFDIFNIPKNEAEMLELPLKELLRRLGEVPGQ